MGRARQWRQYAVLLKETNNVDEKKLDAFIAHVESPETIEAWLLDSDQQATDEKTGHYLQVLSSRSGIPLNIYRDQDDNTDKDKKKKTGVRGNIGEIAAQTENEAMVILEGRNSKDGRLLWLGIALAGAILTFLVAIFLVYK